MSTVTVFDHPLIRQKLTDLRNRNTRPPAFRALLNEIAALMVFEITRDLPTRTIPVSTPLKRTKGAALNTEVILVPVLRAGLEMAQGILNLIPNARVGHIGIYRDKKSLQPVRYYSKFPVLAANSHVFVIDPMLATGGSASDAIRLVKEKGRVHIGFVCLVAAPEGIRLLQKEHPDVPIYTAAVDERLNGHGYILPGLGDAGDRLYGTS